MKAEKERARKGEGGGGKEEEEEGRMGKNEGARCNGGEREGGGEDVRQVAVFALVEIEVP